MLFRGTTGQAVLSYVMSLPLFELLGQFHINFKFGLATIVLSHSIECLFTMAIQLQDFIDTINCTSVLTNLSQCL